MNKKYLFAIMALVLFVSIPLFSASSINGSNGKPTAINVTVDDSGKQTCSENGVNIKCETVGQLQPDIEQEMFKVDADSEGNLTCFENNLKVDCAAQDIQVSDDGNTVTVTTE